MGVKAGYKQTEVGVIPEDWGIAVVGDVAEVKTGPFGTALHERDYANVGTPIITVEHIGERGVIYVNLPLVSDADRIRLKAYALRQGDIVFSRVGSVDRNALIGLAEDGWLFSGRLLRVRPYIEKINSHYLSYHFHSEGFKQRIRNAAVGQTMASINTQILMSMKAAFPPTKAEQQAIAEALSDADALIESLEQLLAKKRLLKQGAMQESLTGKRRLPGFEVKRGYKQTEVGVIPEDWEVTTLREAAQFINGRAYALHEWETHGTPVIRLQNLTGRGEEYYYSNLQLPEKQYCYEGDLLFMWSATFGPILWWGERAIYHYHIWKIECKDNFDKMFLYYLLESMTERLKQKSSSGGTMLHVTKEEMEATKVIFPSPPEQIRIANILFDIDSEISALELKLTKTRQLKQGMMQELLTGRIRLI